MLFDFSFFVAGKWDEKASGVWPRTRFNYTLGDQYLQIGNAVLYRFPLGDFRIIETGVAIWKGM